MLIKADRPNKYNN